MNEEVKYLVNAPDGLPLIQGTPWRSAPFWATSVNGILCVSVVVYLLVRHWKVLSEFSIVGLGVFVGVHLIYQWWRALNYYAKVRELCGMKSGEELTPESPYNAALRIAVGGINDILFYSFGMTLICLFLISTYLSRLDSIR